MNENILFDLAVRLIREKRHTSLEIIDAVEQAATGNPDVRPIVNAAHKFVETFQAECLEAAVGAAHRGMSHFEIAKRLRSLGIQSWDADLLGARAIKTAQDEQKADAELLDDGISALGKSDGHQS